MSNSTQTYHRINVYFCVYISRLTLWNPYLNYEHIKDNHFVVSSPEIKRKTFVSAILSKNDTGSVDSFNGIADLKIFMVSNFFYNILQLANSMSSY